MRYLHVLLLGVLCPLVISAQLPNPVYRAFTYQAVARDANGDPLANQTVGIRFVLGYGIGTIYAESQTLATNQFGLFTAKVGEGVKDPSYPDFPDVSWNTLNPSNLGFWMQVGIDPTGGTNYVFPGGSPVDINAVLFAQRARVADRAEVVGDSAWVELGNVVYNTDKNVGIGTDTPPYKLTVRQDAIGTSHESEDGTIRMGTYVDNSFGAFLQTHSNDPLNFSTNNGFAQMTLLQNGNLGVGTATPAGRLHVNGQVVMNANGADWMQLNDLNGTPQWDISNNSGSSLIISESFVAPRLTLEAGGNMGVNTLDPETALDVSGNVRIADAGNVNGPDPSAALEVASTTGAVLLPRMTTAQRDALTPTPGMIIFNNQTGKFQGYATVAMSSIGASSNVGLTWTYVSDDGFFADYPAQSFQVASDGTLDTLSFWKSNFFSGGFTSMDVDIMVYEGLPNTPGALLASTQVSIDNVPGQVDITFPSNPTLTTNVDYHFVISPTVSGPDFFTVLRSNGSTPGGHAAGTLWYYDGVSDEFGASGVDDLQFRIVLENSTAGWVDLH